MRVVQLHCQQLALPDTQDWQRIEALAPQLILVFAAPAYFQAGNLFQQLRKRWPLAHLVGCSSAGEVGPLGVTEQGAVVTAIHFQHTRVQVSTVRIADMAGSGQAGQILGRNLAAHSPAAVLLFARGLHVNGSALVEGLRRSLAEEVAIFGGLAGDEGRFSRTWLVADDMISDDLAVAVALVGPALSLSTGSAGGWLPVGPARRITRSADNVLIEMDEQPALALYKRYLGDAAADLPAAGLRFPLACTQAKEGADLIRTMLGMDEEAGTLIMAGDVPQGARVQMMQASVDALIDGAELAARQACHAQPAAELMLLVSCIGRRLVMQARVQEEIDAVSECDGAACPLAGFYAYGEFAPDAQGAARLHNQTMTIARLREQLPN